tara:strand:- start:106608 stop:107150 length:543 start_codon:yes stop_codon:yes gene_type:complete
VGMHRPVITQPVQLIHAFRTGAGGGNMLLLRQYILQNFKAGQWIGQYHAEHDGTATIPGFRCQRGSGYKGFAPRPLVFLDALGEAVQHLVDFIHLRRGCGGQFLFNKGRYIAVSKNIQLRLRHQLEIRFGIDHAGKRVGFLNTLFNQNFITAAADNLQTGMQQHGNPGAGTFQSVGTQIP